MKTVTGRKANTRSIRKTAHTAGLDLKKLLLDGLAARGLRPVVRRAPSGNYVSLLVGKQNVAYVERQTRNGLKVIVAAQPVDLKGAKGFVASGRSGRFGAQLLVTTEREVAQAALGVKLAAEKATAAKTTTTTTAAAKAKPVPTRARKGGRR